MRKVLVLVSVLVAFGAALGQGEVMTPGGLPTPLGPVWKKMGAAECQAAWEALKEEVKQVTLRGLPEPKGVRCLFFEKGQRNVPLRWEMGNKTLDQVFTEGWERQKGVFEMLQARNRAHNRFTFQPTPKSLIALFVGFNQFVFSPWYELVYGLERENDVVLIELLF